MKKIVIFVTLILSNFNNMYSKRKQKQSVAKEEKSKKNVEICRIDTAFLSPYNKNIDKNKREENEGATKSNSIF